MQTKKNQKQVFSLVPAFVLRQIQKKGLPEAIILKLDNWKHTQILDYEQLPYKFKTCHEYGHFAKHFKNTQQNPDQNNKEDQWQTAQKQQRKARQQLRQDHEDQTLNRHPTNKDKRDKQVIINVCTQFLLCQKKIISLNNKNIFQSFYICFKDSRNQYI